MFILRKRGWDTPERAVTPEAVSVGRRALLAAAAAGAGMAGGSALAGWNLFGGDDKPAAKPAPPPRPLAAGRNARFDPGRAVTSERAVATYNNFYEFGASKSIYEAAQALPVEPWTIQIAGMVQTPRSIGLDDLL